MNFSTETLKAAHKHCTANRQEIAASEFAACFYCKAIYPAATVTEFLDDGTALCPKCPVDSVLGDKSGHPVADPVFLAAMHGFWFERTVSMPEASVRLWAGQTKKWIGRLLGVDPNKKKFNA